LDQGEARRIRDGDHAAVGAVYRAYEGLVFAVVYKVLATGDSPRDAASVRPGVACGKRLRPDPGVRPMAGRSAEGTRAPARSCRCPAA
jgi:hypothetical protein